MRKRIVYTLALVVSVTGASFFLFFKGDRNNYTLRYDKVSKGSLTVFVTATGTIDAVTSVDVGTQVSGIVTKLYADFNSVVKEGQIIAQIDTTFLVQAVADAVASLERAKAQAADARRTYDRTAALFRKQLASQADFDAALTNRESSSASLKQADAALQRAKINLRYAYIYAPINGVVTNRAVNVGQTVAASFSSPLLFTIANDLKKMQVLATVDESDIGRVSIGQTATFTVDAYPEQKFAGTVSQVRLAPVTIQNVVNYTVVIAVNNDDLKLMPGMTANVKLLVASSNDVLKVPNMALRMQPPLDLVDTAKVNEMRERFGRGRLSPGSDTSTSATASAAQGAGRSMTDAGVQGQGWAGRGEDQPGGGMSLFRGNRRFQAIRDSLVNAYGSTLDREELRKKIFSVLSQEFNELNAPTTEIRTIPRKADNTRFGITNLYPEYEKSAYDPTSERTRGRVWITNAAGKLEPIPVVTGLNDGKFTEVIAPRLNEGDKIVIGVTSNAAESASQQNRSPFQPQAQMGGRGR